MFTHFDSEFYSSIRGALLVVFIYHIIIYFQNNKKLYLYFSIYSLLLFLYLLRNLLIPDFSKGWASYLNYPIQYATFASFIVFSRELLHTQKQLVKWDKYLKLTIRILLVLCLTLIFLNLVVGFNIQRLIYFFTVPLFYVFILVSLVKFLKIEGGYVRLFVIFSFTFYTLFMITYAGYIFPSLELFFQEINIDKMLFFYIGSVIQIMIIAAIIGFRIRELEESRISSEIQLSKQTSETSELRMTALQSQMNPHFLFNSLNSINNFVIKSQVEKASDYITKFSKLIREILKNSSRNTIPLSEELSNLKIYVLLENIRIDGGFTYDVQIDPSIKSENINVPPLFLQPYVENAIWHGLTHIAGEKCINLNITKEEDSLKFEIIDNGIGINKSREQAEIKRDERKGFATKATDIRIRTLFQNKDVVIDIVDISTEKTTGTKVTIIFPLIESK